MDPIFNTWREAYKKKHKVYPSEDKDIQRARKALERLIKAFADNPQRLEAIKQAARGLAESRTQPAQAAETATVNQQGQASQQADPQDARRKGAVKLLKKGSEKLKAPDKEWNIENPFLQRAFGYRPSRIATDVVPRIASGLMDFVGLD